MCRLMCNFGIRKYKIRGFKLPALALIINICKDEPLEWIQNDLVVVVVLLSSSHFCLYE